MCLIRKSIVIFLSLCAVVGLSADTACPREQAVGPNRIPSDLITGKIQYHDPLFFVSFESVQALLRSKQDLALVDVRDLHDFEKVGIPGSINIPLFAVKRKTFLRPKHVVLVNEGFNYRGLEQECRRLKKAGFSHVSILIGGVANWKQEGTPLKGDYFSQGKLNKISPQDLFAERHYKHLAIINVSGEKKNESAFLIPQARSVPYRGKAEAFLNRLKEMPFNSQKDPLSSVLICNARGDYPKKLEDLIRSAGIKNVFYLRGGLKAYTIFLRRQVDILRAMGKRQIVKRCPTCP